MKLDKFLSDNDFKLINKNPFVMGCETKYRSGNFVLMDYSVKAVRSLQLLYKKEIIYTAGFRENKNNSFDEMTLLIREIKFKDIFND